MGLSDYYVGQLSGRKTDEPSGSDQNCKLSSCLIDYLIFGKYHNADPAVKENQDDYIHAGMEELNELLKMLSHGIGTDKETDKNDSAVY